MEIQGLENQSGDICPKSLLGFFFSFILLTREKLQCQMFKSTWGCVLFFFLVGSHVVTVLWGRIQ